MYDLHRPQKLEASQTTKGGMKTRFAALAGILDSTQNSSLQSKFQSRSAGLAIFRWLLHGPATCHLVPPPSQPKGLTQQSTIHPRALTQKLLSKFLYILSSFFLNNKMPT